MKMILAVILVLATPSLVHAQTWTPKTAPPFPIVLGSCSIREGAFAYVLVGGTGNFVRYDPVADSWAVLAPLPDVVAPGSGLASAGGGGFLYGAPGGGNDNFYRFDIPGSNWIPMPDVPQPISDGGGLASLPGINAVLAIQGGGGTGCYSFHAATTNWSLNNPTPVPVDPGTCFEEVSPDDIVMILGAWGTYNYDGVTDGWINGVAAPQNPLFDSELHFDGTDLYYYPGVGSTELYISQPAGAPWTALAPPPGLPGVDTEMFAVAGEFFFIDSTGMFAATPAALIPASCNCGDEAELGGCSAGGGGGMFAGILVGLLILAYGRFRSAVS